MLPQSMRKLWTGILYKYKNNQNMEKIQKLLDEKVKLRSILENQIISEIRKNKQIQLQDLQNVYVLTILIDELEKLISCDV